MFNKILRKREIPPQWLNGNITRLYKGKGTKGKCSNERGITLASNIGKLFERMVNNRATLMADMTDAQAGGQKGRATTDHLLIHKEAINAARTQKQPVYATFLDVTKAYDKAWIDAIMYVMKKREINSQIWAIINKANLRDLIAATGLVISNWIQIVNFSARVTVKFDGWPCKTIGHLFYATSSFVHLFVPIGEFKLKLQSGNAQSGSNWMIFRAVRPWNLTDDLAKQ